MIRVTVIISVYMLLCLNISAQAKNLNAINSSDGTRISPEIAKNDLSKPSDPAKPSDLERCIEIALEKNRRRSVSALAVEIARHQQKQALSSYWPKLVLGSKFTQMDEELNFIFPQETSNYTITMPMPPAGLVPIPTTVTVPEKTIKLMDKDNTITALDLSYPLFTGGIRSAIIKQAKSGVQAATQEARRTDLQIVYDVKRMYYGAVLAAYLHEIGKNALGRLDATLKITQRLYKEGSGSVSKSDYLQSKIMVETVRSGVASLAAGKEIAKAALLNALGLSWSSNFELSETQIPFNPYTVNLEQLVSDTYKFNPDWKRLLTGIEAAKAKIKEQKGGRLPKLALTGKLWRIDNSYDAGIVSDENKDGWQAGVGLQIPLFSGFLTTGKINEAKAGLKKLTEQKFMLKEGLALQIKHIFLMMDSFKKQVTAAGKAEQNARKNLDLNIRAYDSELVELEDVIKAQLIDSFMKMQHCRARYNHAEAQFHLDFLVGSEIKKRMK